MSISQRRGLICLIPKKGKDPFNVRHWQPITLLSVDYKLLSKALALCLQVVIPDWIHTNQKGFVKGWYIGDKILDVYSLLSRAEENDEQAALLLLDIEKAFDSVSWSFLRKVLDTYMFPDPFIHWIETLYSNKEVRVVNNGHVSSMIKPTNGLTQGDGLSPLLFILVIETLALSIRHNANITGISSHHIQKKIALLADDAILALHHDTLTVADPGFPRGGGTNSPGGGHQHMILSKFPQNCMKLKEFGPPGGHVSKILLCRSATELHLLRFYILWNSL